MRTPTAARMRAFLLKVVAPKIALLIIVIFGWNVLAARSKTNLIPTTGDIWYKTYQLFSTGELWPQLGATVERVLVGFALSFVLSVIIGVVMGRNKIVNSFFEPAILVGLTIPGLAWAFMAVVWFGINWKTPALAVVLTATPLLVLNIYEGTRAVDVQLVEMAHIYKFGRWLRWRYVYLPSLTPYLLSGARVALSLGWKVVALTEVFGLSNGIGYQLNSAFSQFDIAGLFAWTLAFTLVMFLFEYGIMTVLERHFTRWRRAAHV